MLSPFSTPDPQYSQLYVEALQLLDHCLALNNTEPLVAFVEQQVVNDPPDLDFLREFAEALSQRVLSLRTNLYDIRENVVRIFGKDYGIDITPLTPANAMEQYYTLLPADLLAYVRKQPNQPPEDDMAMLAQLIEVSLKTATRLTAAIRLTRELEALVQDWRVALNNSLGRRSWPEEQSRQTRIH